MDKTALQDMTKTGRMRPWGVHKIMNEMLAIAYDDIEPKRAERLRGCATKLSFDSQSDGSLRFKGTWFCRVRLCPMCSWRRSLKVAAQMRQIMDAIKADKPMGYIMLTLTMRNSKPDQLNGDFTRLLRAFSNLTKLDDYIKAAHGYYRAVEVTHNLDDDTFHPHIHAVIAVNPSYFSSRDYLAQARWTEMWQQSLRVDYTPIVHVQRIRGDTAKAVAEVAKYAVKSGDYIIPEDWNMTVDTVRLLDSVMHNRHFIGFGGLFRDYHRKLHLDDIETGDLVNLDGEPDDPGTGGEHLVHFAWYSGYRQYRKEE